MDHNANECQQQQLIKIIKTQIIKLTGVAGAAEAVEAPLDETLLCNCFSKIKSVNYFKQLSCLRLLNNDI